MAKGEVPEGLPRVAIRMVSEPPLYSPVPVDSPERAIAVLANFMKDMDREVFGVLNLKSNLQPINFNLVSQGILDASLVSGREIFKSSILSNSKYMLACHFHPSGSLEPSRDDVMVTDQIRQIGELLGIPLVDHVIFSTGDQYYSFNERGTLPVPDLHLEGTLEKLQFGQVKVAEKKESLAGKLKKKRAVVQGDSKKKGAEKCQMEL